MNGKECRVQVPAGDFVLSEGLIAYGPFLIILIYK